MDPSARPRPPARPNSYRGLRPPRGLRLGFAARRRHRGRRRARALALTAALALLALVPTALADSGSAPSSPVALADSQGPVDTNDPGQNQHGALDTEYTPIAKPATQSQQFRGA